MSNGTNAALSDAQSLCLEGDALSRRCHTDAKDVLLAELATLRERAKKLPRRHPGDYGHQADDHLDTVEGRIHRRCKR